MIERDLDSFSCRVGEIKGHRKCEERMIHREPTWIFLLLYFGGSQGSHLILYSEIMLEVAYLVPVGSHAR